MFYEKPEWKEEAEVSMNSLPDFYTASELAILLHHKTPSYINRLCREKKIFSYRLGSYHVIPEKEVERYLRSLKEKD